MGVHVLVLRGRVLMLIFRFGHGSRLTRDELPGKRVVVRPRPAPLPAVLEAGGHYHRKGDVQHRPAGAPLPAAEPEAERKAGREPQPADRDRKSTRLNSSHVAISYAVFC